MVSEERYFSQRRFPRELHPAGLRFTPRAKSAIHTISSDILSETEEVISSLRIYLHTKMY